MKIRVTDRNGNTHELDGDTSATLMEILRDAGLEIEAACGGCCACATCHVYIDEKWLDILNVNTQLVENIKILQKSLNIKIILLHIIINLIIF